MFEVGCPESDRVHVADIKVLQTAHKKLYIDEFGSVRDHMGPIMGPMKAFFCCV